MKPGDMVKNKNSLIGEYGLFIGMRTFKVSKKNPHAKDYSCAEVMWYTRSAPNGDRISTIQPDLIEVINEAR